MIKKHLKRLNMPKTWPLRRKGIKYTTRPNPGKKMEYSLPINTVLRDLVEMTDTVRETKYLLKEKEVFVDGKRVRDHKYPVGLMDVLTFPETDEHYRLMLSENGKLAATKIDKNLSGQKVSKVINKTKVKKKTQLNLIDSRNILVEKDEVKNGDSVLIEIPSQKILGVLKMEKGANVILISGKHIGNQGVVEEINEKNIIINLASGNKIQTLKKYAFVIGK